jgi:hypothetical protein
MSFATPSAAKLLYPNRRPHQLEWGVSAASRRMVPDGLILSVLMCFLWQSARADEVGLGSSMFSVNGFGTAGVVHTNEHEADFTSSEFKPNGAGFSHDWSVDVDSRIGAQLTAGVSPRLSAVVQVIAEQGYDNTYRPTLEWANIKYQVTPDFGVRLGRIELPAFMFSDVRKIGYANPWVRPPEEVYGVAPVTNNDGVDLSYRMHFGPITNTLQAAYGPQYKLDFPAAGINTRNLWGVFESAEYAAALFHISYLEAKATEDPDSPLFGVFRQFGPPGAEIADTYDLNRRGVSIVSVGASYDPGGWFAMSEWTRISSHSFLSVNTAWYVSSGYRIKRFTPYLTISQISAPTVPKTGLVAADYPPQLSSTIAALNAGLEETLHGTYHVQRTVSVGGRWDVAKHIDLKVQYDYTRIGADSSGTLINAQPGFQPGGTVNIFSATVDFVF